jgi:hypothetical protein
MTSGVHPKTTRLKSSSSLNKKKGRLRIISRAMASETPEKRGEVKTRAYFT